MTSVSSTTLPLNSPTFRLEHLSILQAINIANNIEQTTSLKRKIELWTVPAHANPHVTPPACRLPPSPTTSAGTQSHLPSDRLPNSPIRASVTSRLPHAGKPVGLSTITPQTTWSHRSEIFVLFPKLNYYATLVKKDQNQYSSERC